MLSQPPNRIFGISDVVGIILPALYDIGVVHFNIIRLVLKRKKLHLTVKLFFAVRTPIASGQAGTRTPKYRHKTRDPPDAIGTGRLTSSTTSPLLI